jgi:uncharacterized membrane protein (DUF373 family)
MVEVAIVTLLRGLMLEGLQRLSWLRVAAVSLLLLVLGALLAVDRWLSRADEDCPPGNAH